jgi:hypothetical protein
MKATTLEELNPLFPAHRDIEEKFAVCAKFKTCLLTGNKKLTTFLRSAADVHFRQLIVHLTNRCTLTKPLFLIVQWRLNNKKYRVKTTVISISLWLIVQQYI